MFEYFCIFVQLADATLRSAISWKKFNQKKLDQKKFKKKIQKSFREFFFQFFFGYNGSTFNLESACKNLGGLGPLV
jgi:hypothetical protein